MKMKYKLLIDIIMMIGFIFLFDINITGIFLHEILGLIILVIFILHNGFNIKWITSVSKMVVHDPKRIRRKSFSMYTINLILVILNLIVIVTGVFISQYLFDNFANNINLPVSQLHYRASYMLLTLIIIHLLLHFKLLKSYKVIALIFVSLMFFGIILAY